MRIGIAGAHRVGKTTTAKDVAAHSFRSYLDADVRGALKASGIDAKAAVSFEQRLRVQDLVLEYCSTIYRASADFVTDRTPLDFIGYTLSEYIRGVDFAGLEPQMKDYFDRCVAATNEIFDLVVLIPPAIVCEDCETSAANAPMYIEHIHSVIFSAFNDYVTVPRILIPKSMTDRADRLTHICAYNLVP